MCYKIMVGRSLLKLKTSETLKFRYKMYRRQRVNTVKGALHKQIETNTQE